MLDWQENLLAEEMPPVWMWAFDDELDIWFAEVDAKRKDKYGGGDSSDSTSMMSNELARDRK